VAGTVQYASQPLQEGEIRFVPLDGTIGPLTIAQIIDGKYIANNHEGVPVGRHRVEIRRYDFTDRVPGPGSPPPKQLLPAKYNDKSELVLSVDAGVHDQVADFDLSP